MKKKAAKGAQNEGASLAPGDTEHLKKHPAIIEHCRCRKYEDGDPREPGWITVKTQGSAWVVQVKDPDSATSFSAVGRTLDEALDLAELLLGADDAPWEHDRWLSGRKPGKGKK